MQTLMSGRQGVFQPRQQGARLHTEPDFERPCGDWESPIDSADLVRGALRLSAPAIESGRLYWLEGRPDEGGRQVLMRARLPEPSAAPALLEVEEVLGRDVSVRTRVHEYGGGEFCVWRDRIYYVDDADGRIYRATSGQAPEPIVPAGTMHADLVVSACGDWLFCVEERAREFREPENRILAVPLDGEGRPREAPRVVAAGHDFYASLCCAEQGDQLAFLAWDHPNMPWNGTVLETVAWGPAGARGEVRHRAGGIRESLFQPRFAKDGRLFVVSDRSGWWNLTWVGENDLDAVHEDRFEIGRPQWIFGMSAWAFSEQGALGAATADGIDELVEIDLGSGLSRKLASSLRSISGLVTGAGWAACIGGESDRTAGLYLWRVAGATPICVRESSPLQLGADVISPAIPMSFTSVGGRTAHAFLYQPKSGVQRPRAGERPPLLVKSHGGPTASASAALDPRIQYWTSRGFAVADVNYGGSSGFGRAYRDQLEERWGVVDVEDCVAVAKALAAEGLVDGDRLAISGGSAGGYTTLCALTFYDTFAAGASHYGIGDLEALAADTHKFESRYTDWLVGPLPETRARYVERSPIHHVEQLACPVIFFQGLEDRVVPPNQAEAMVAVLAERGLAYGYVPFEGEQHGFRRSENIRTALDGELYFYSRLFGFDAPKPAGVEVIGARN